MSVPVERDPGVVSRTIDVAAPADAVLDLLADPRRHAELDGSGTVRGTVTGPSRLTAGARFVVSMRYLGVPYRMVNRVVEFEPGRCLAWSTLARVGWRYDVEPLDDGGCRVTETWDIRSSPARALYRLLGYPRRTDAAIAATLVTLKRTAEAGPGQPGAQLGG